MSRQKFYDVPDGDTMILDVVDENNGYRQCTYMMPESIRYTSFNDIKHVDVRDDDVMIYSYPKTGTNWLWEMLKMMINKTSQVSGGNKVAEMLETKPTSSLERLPSPRFINSHIKVQYLPTKAVNKRLKTIFLYRNPKDVAVSFYHHVRGIKAYEYSGKFENFLHMFMRGETDYGSYPEYLLEWQEHMRNNPDVPFHVVMYEDLKEDCYGELKRLQVFLGLGVSEDLLHEIVDNCAINKMKVSKAKNMAPELIEATKKFVHPGFSVMRKGQIGDWKNWFTVGQNELFDTWWKQETKDLEMFNFRYS